MKGRKVMLKGKVRSIFKGIILSLIVSFLPYIVQAGQPEPSVQCVEGQEPLYINYGEHTTNCQIDNITDQDSFSFNGSEGENIRVMVSQPTILFEPHVEIWDPNGNKIKETWGQTIIVDASLVTSGTYAITIYDQFLDETGGYELEIQCLTGSCPGLPPISPTIDIVLNQEEFHTGDTLIVSAHVVNGPNPVKVEVKTWMDKPNGDTKSILNPHLTYTVGPNANFTKTIYTYTFKGSTPSGEYAVGGRFLDPTNGRQISLDIEGFNFTP